jgi:hypothetical protein
MSRENGENLNGQAGEYQRFLLVADEVVVVMIQL